MLLKGIFKTLHYYLHTRLNWQITLPLLLFMLFVGASGTYVLRILVQDNLQAQFLQRGELAAHSVQYAVETASILGGIQRYVAALSAEDGIDRVIVVAGQPPHVIASSERVLIGMNASKIPDGGTRDALAAVRNVRSPWHEFHHTAGHLAYGSPVLISNVVKNGIPLGEGAVLINISTDELTGAVNKTLWTLTTLFITLLITLSVLLLWLVRRYVLSPQRRLMATVKARQHGEKVMTTVEGENEFARLGDAFNEMLRVGDSVDRLKSEFVSTVSHELRTPLTSIRGAVGLILGNASSTLPAETLDLLKMAERNVNRLTILVNDILDLEKIESGSLKFNFVPLDLVELVRNALAANTGYARQHRVTLSLGDCPQLAPVMGDENRLQQVLANLLSNAIKFSPSGETVEVSLDEVRDRYRVIVKDYGSGIPESFRTQIFQRFAQADSSDSRQSGGTGLGLNISKLIVEHHNGVIGFDSRLKVGTEFYFELPALDKAANNATLIRNEAV